MTPFDRFKLVQQRNAVDNRIQKVLETTNIKLGSVASDVLGVSGRKMIEGLIAGEKNVAALADLAHRQLRGKIAELQRALEGELTEHHRFCCARCWHSTTFSKRKSQA